MMAYKLTHRRHIEYKLHTGEPVTDNRLIGFFDSAEVAESVADSLREKPGYADHPDDFFVDRYELPGEGNCVYLAEHSYFVEDDRFDTIVEIGVFAAEDEAMAAAEEYRRMSKIPVGAYIWDEGFDIDNFVSVMKFELGEIDFADGF